MAVGLQVAEAPCPIYDGEAMAKKGIVFVSINYRVGIFGFFAHPELTKESGHIMLQAIMVCWTRLLL